jgi:hypothetical protein
MTTFNGLVGIVFNFPAIIASKSLSSQRPVLIHQFDDGHEAPRHVFLPHLQEAGAICALMRAYPTAEAAGQTGRNPGQRLGATRASEAGGRCGSLLTSNPIPAAL